MADRLLMVESVEKALEAMKWLVPSDGALVDMARLYAQQIDELIADDPLKNTGRAASLGQLLARVLHELGGTPTVRMQHELRSLRAKAGLPAGGADESDDEQPVDPRGVASVIPIQRPSKRRSNPA